MRKVLFSLHILRNPWLNLAWALIGGLMMGMTAAPFGAWYFAWVAIIPLWFLIHEPKYSAPISQTPKVSFRYIKALFCIYRQPLIYSLIWGFGYQGLTLFWITGIHPMTWMGVPWFWSLCIAIICWLIITIWGMGIPFLWTMGMLFFRHQSIPIQGFWQYRFSRIVYGAALWCVIEYLWSRGDLFWHFLAFSQSPHNLSLLQLVRFSGFSTVTAVIVLVNGCFSECLLDYSKKYLQGHLQGQKKSLFTHDFLIAGIVIFTSAHLLGFWTLQTVEITNGKSAEIGIIQGNIPNEIKLYKDGTSQAIANYTVGYKSLTNKNIDLIVTPETALPFKIEQVIAWTDFYRIVLREKIPVLLGAFGAEGKNFTNSLFLIGSQGEIMSRYNKQQLVPLGEYIPFEAVLGKFIDRLSPLDAHLVRGVNPPTVNTPIGRAALAICYESAYPEHFRRQTAAGGKFIVVASNDAHYSPTMPAQHHALDVMQAIANDRWTVRASNTGYSAIVTPTGETQWISNLDEYAVHDGTIYLRTTKTLYVRYGNWLIPLNLVLIFLLVAYWKSR